VLCKKLGYDPGRCPAVVMRETVTTTPISAGDGGAGWATHAGGAWPGLAPPAPIARRALQDPGYTGADELQSHHGGHPRGGLRAHCTTTAAAGAASRLRCMRIWDVRGCVARLTGQEKVAGGTYSLPVSLKLTPQQLRATLRPGMPQQPTAWTTRGPVPAKARKAPNIWSAGCLMGHSVPSHRLLDGALRRNAVGALH
jgi:hypothetical protein